MPRGEQESGDKLRKITQRKERERKERNKPRHKLRGLYKNYDAQIILITNIMHRDIENNKNS